MLTVSQLCCCVLAVGAKLWWAPRTTAIEGRRQAIGHALELSSRKAHLDARHADTQRQQAEDKAEEERLRAEEERAKARHAEELAEKAQTQVELEKARAHVAEMEVRMKEVRMKEAERPFKLPGGTAVAAMACIPPLVICLATLGANLMEPIHAAAFGGALMVGIVGHLVAVALCRTRSSSARAEGYESAPDG